LEYGFPAPARRAGEAAVVPAQCGITKDALDPTKDKEGLSFRANQAAGRKR